MHPFCPVTLVFINVLSRVRWFTSRFWCGCGGRTKERFKLNGINHSFYPFFFLFKALPSRLCFNTEIRHAVRERLGHLSSTWYTGPKGAAVPQLRRNRCYPDQGTPKVLIKCVCDTVITDKAKNGRGRGRRCRCYERWKVKDSRLRVSHTHGWVEEPTTTWTSYTTTTRNNSISVKPEMS